MKMAQKQIPVVQRIAPKAAIWGVPLALTVGWIIFPATCKNWSGYNGTVPTGLSYLTAPPKPDE